MTDYEFGIHQENIVLPTLKKQFGDDLTKTTDRYAPFDFENATSVIELKSRRCNHDTFSTVMVSQKKIKDAQNEQRDVYFCFNYQDGIYYFKVDKNYKFEFNRGGRFDRGRAEWALYTYVPSEQLTCIG